MARSSVVGYWRQYGGGNKKSTPAVLMSALQFSFDPTQASASVGKILPVGAIPLGVRSLGGATGGTNPTVNIGTLADSDGFALNLDADNVTGETITGALLGIPLTATAEIYAGVGSSAATGGATTAVFEYLMSDDGSA